MPISSSTKEFWKTETGTNWKGKEEMWTLYEDWSYKRQMLEVTWTSKIKDVVEELDHMFIYLISQTILQSSDDNSGSSLSIEELQNVRRFMNQIEILTKDASSASVHSGKSSNPSGMISPYSWIIESGATDHWRFLPNFFLNALPEFSQNCYPVAVLLKNSQGSGHKKNDWQW